MRINVPTAEAARLGELRQRFPFASRSALALVLLRLALAQAERDPCSIFDEAAGAGAPIAPGLPFGTRTRGA